MKLIHYTDKGFFLIDMESRNKEELFSQIISFMHDTGIIQNSSIKKVLNEFCEREALSSTGLGNHIAFPHIMMDSINEPIIIFCRTKYPIEFDSIDSKPVSLFFFLLGRTNFVSEHLQILSRLAFLLKDKDFSNELKKESNKSKLWLIFKNKDLKTP